MLKYFFSETVFVSILIFVFGITYSADTQDTKNNYSKVVHTFNEAWNTGNYNLCFEIINKTITNQSLKLISY